MSDLPLTETIKAAMKAAMKARDKERLGTIRLIQSEIKRIEVDERIELDDARVLVVLDRMIKQRRDSAQQYHAAVANAGGSGMQAMGAVMAELKPKLQGRADIGAVSKLVKARLSA